MTDKEGLAITSQEHHLYREAITALNGKELDKAEELLKDFGKLKPQLAGPLANLALIYYKQGKLEESEKMAHRALALNPEQANSLNLLGQIAYEKGLALESEKYYKQAIGIKADYANAHYNLALLYDILFQDIGKAVVHYRRYVELTDGKDNDTVNWLEQLENSLKGG